MLQDGESIPTISELDGFLIREGLDLLAAYRMIRSEGARRSVMDLVVEIARAERQAREGDVGLDRHYT